VLVEEIACRLCFPRATDYGQLLADYYLVEQDEKWFIVDSNGHNRLIEFRGRPRPDPDADKSDVEINNQSHAEQKIWDAWLDDAMGLVVRGGDAGEYLIPATMDLGIECYLSGWKNPAVVDDLTINTINQDPRVWLYERAAKLIAQRESGT
jgi:hypothetical protein